MPKKEAFFSSFSNLPYFTKDQLRLSAERFAISKNTLDSYIQKGLKSAQILGLKKKYYVTRPFFEAHKTDSSYLFTLSNILVRPSYISMETALQYYGLFTEAVHYNYTSVTTKLPRQFMTRAGNYAYRKIKNELFTGYTTVKERFEFTIALPYKAVFDYLYYYTNCFTKNVHPDLLEELRIDAGALPPPERKKLATLLSEFTSIKIRL